MADDVFGGSHPEGSELAEDGLASILGEAATVCERLALDHRVSMVAGGEVCDVLSVLHTMLDRAQELVGQLAKELAAARKPDGQGLSAVRMQIEQVLAEQRARQEIAIQGMRSHTEQAFGDLTWRVGMLGEQVEALAASFDALKGTEARPAEGAVESALGAFEAEVGEFLSLFRDRAASVSDTIVKAGSERERAIAVMIERAEAALEEARVLDTSTRERAIAVTIERAEAALEEARVLDASTREREKAIVAMLERVERMAASISAPAATIETKPEQPTKTARAAERKTSVKSAKSAAKLTIKAPVSIKTKARSLRAAA